MTPQDSVKRYRMLVLVFLFLMSIVPTCMAAKGKVLVVMSYEEDYLWDKEIKEGIDAVLSTSHNIKYFYMDTKKNPEGGPAKVVEAFALYQEFQPDGVITADDNAQKMFVVEYLKDKVKTPVMFCGVNAAPEDYGFPATNVSGILERAHVAESLDFLRQLLPETKTFGYIMRGDSSTAKGVIKQLESEASSYPVQLASSALPTNLKEAIAGAGDLKNQCDALFLTSLQGLPDDGGNALAEKDIIPAIMKAFGKAAIADDLFRVKNGALCAVVKTGQEQGNTAAEMLLKAMKGTPVSQIPITKNQFGRRIINVDTLKALGITPKPAVVRGAEIVKTEH